MEKTNKIQKVREEPYNNSEMYQCQRCKDEAESEGWYCDCCNPSQEVEFDIEEQEDLDEMQRVTNWKGQDVCPWCYNQLVDLKNKTEAPNSSQA
jgi:hypothetical protein